jgi:hypothetical protein
MGMMILVHFSSYNHAFGKYPIPFALIAQFLEQYLRAGKNEQVWGLATMFSTSNTFPHIQTPPLCVGCRPLEAAQPF